ncbi:MAG: hypothetical protein AAAC47_26105, partial [Pararhizobium sp.]
MPTFPRAVVERTGQPMSVLTPAIRWMGVSPGRLKRLGPLKPDDSAIGEGQILLQAGRQAGDLALRCSARFFDLARVMPLADLMNKWRKHLAYCEGKT